ncbi:MAG: hypothetical protein A3E79_08455 [Burkholderiales bacterium RIFCSPHIGHO2_12_FULL_61_11]|nr:MAG: hypothetical protein A3E79_08455 [Burkholderiales bacterium RIFCSPHIGHO2_12_FULL_61_11]
MFSDHLQKIDKVSSKTLLGVAAGLVIVCQLIAMALVADGQVKNAQWRDASERIVMAQCRQSPMGGARQSCIEQARAALSPSREADTRQIAKAADSTSDIESTMPSHQVQSFMPASFVMR